MNGYRILDLTTERGTFAAQLLGSFGADVIKIEPPGGDPSRRLGPFAQDIPDPERGLFWLAYNTNKRSITLDLETPTGQALLRRMVLDADALIESFEPGYLERLGLGAAALRALNPKLVFTSITPFGQSGPYQHFKASDLDVWAMGGMLSSTGDPHTSPVHISHLPMAWLLASQDAAFGTAMALYWRSTSGRGQQVDISVQESVVRTTFLTRESWLVTGKQPRRSSTGHQVGGSGVILKKIWEARDGHVAYMLFGGQFGARQVPALVDWMDQEGMADDYLKSVDWSTLDWGSKTVEEADRIQGYFVRFFKSKTKAELDAGSSQRRIMIQPLCTPREILSHPQLAARNYWQDVEYPHLDLTIRYPGRACTPSRMDCSIRRRAPRLGEHNLEIYRDEMGMTDSEVGTLKQLGVI